MQTAASNIVPLHATVAASAGLRPAFRINPELVLRRLLLASIVLAILDLATMAANPLVESEQLRRIFNVDEEVSIPTWFSIIQLFVAAVLVGAIAAIKRILGDRFAAQWGMLAVIMLALSLDEGSGIHESGIHVLRTAGFGGDWVYLGAPVAAIIGLLYVRFLIDLPRATATMFCVAGGVMLAGAIGVESLHLSVWTRDPSFQEGLVPATEELLERAGIAVFIYALLAYITGHMGVGGIAIAEPEAARRREA